jgi:hypothetical protein
MPLVPAKLKTDLYDMFISNIPAPTDSQKSEVDKLAGNLATIIDSYFKSATITSIPVLVSPSGPVTGTITNTIS